MCIVKWIKVVLDLDLSDTAEYIGNFCWMTLALLIACLLIRFTFLSNIPYAFALASYCTGYCTGNQSWGGFWSCPEFMNWAGYSSDLYFYRQCTQCTQFCQGFLAKLSNSPLFRKTWAYIWHRLETWLSLTVSKLYQLYKAQFPLIKWDRTDCHLLGT